MGTMEEIPKPCFSKAQPPSPSTRTPIRLSLAWRALDKSEKADVEEASVLLLLGGPLSPANPPTHGLSSLLG